MPDGSEFEKFSSPNYSEFLSYNVTEIQISQMRTQFAFFDEKKRFFFSKSTHVANLL